MTNQKRVEILNMIHRMVLDSLTIDSRTGEITECKHGTTDQGRDALDLLVTLRHEVAWMRTLTPGSPN